VRRLAPVLAALALVGPAGAQTPVLPGFSLIFYGPAGGTLVRGVIPGSARKSFVYLPPGYPNAGPYPVVYLLHGMPGSPWEYVESLKLVSAADGLISTGLIRPFVAVVPVAGDSAHYDGEWTGPWEDYVVHSVVPWVDANLQTLATPAGRVLAGLSAGGYGAIDIGLRHPGLFGTLESWSGYFTPFRDGTLAGLSGRELAAYTPTSLVRANAGTLRTDGTQFVLSTGPGHGHVRARDTFAFAQELRSLGLPVRLWVVPAADQRGPYYPQLVHGLLAAFAPT
jgi:enterochelin esterase-like enzyme